MIVDSQWLTFFLVKATALLVAGLLAAGALRRAAELRDVEAVVVRLHDGRERSALAERRHVARRRDRAHVTPAPAAAAIPRRKAAPRAPAPHLRAAPAIGATLTALWFSFRPLKRNVGTRMLYAVGVFGAATVAFGLSRSMALSLVCLALLGAADMFSVYIRQSLIQLHTPDAMRGRVSAASTLAISASNELGETRSGFVAALIGPIAATVAGGIAAIAVTLIWARWFSELRRARTFEIPEEPPPQDAVIASGA